MILISQTGFFDIVSAMLRLSQFKYSFLAGPTSEQELQKPLEIGNCRRAIQEYYHRVCSTYLNEDQLLCPQAYWNTGSFVAKWEEKNEIQTSLLQTSDILYASRKKVDQAQFTIQQIEEDDQKLIKLHTAIFINNPKNIVEFLPLSTNISSEDSYVWHATSIDQIASLCPFEKFLEFYRLVAAKRLINI